jgi:hypothetical protein
MTATSNRIKTEVMLLIIVIFSSFGSTASPRFLIATLFSSFENYKRLKKKVAGPIPDVERYFLKEANDLSLR